VSFLGDQIKKMEIPKLYKQYFVDKNDERKELFEKLKDLDNPLKGIYPGSFVQIFPSFYIKEMTYIDSDKRITKFFADVEVINYINLNKTYKESSSVKALQADFSSDLPIDDYSFDIMFSFYAGLISQSCKK